MTSQEGTSVATWITVLLTLVAVFVTIKGTGPATAPAERPAIIIECPSGEEQAISALLAQMADELNSALRASDATVIANQDQSDRGKRH
jgi:hypothetical protein